MRSRHEAGACRAHGAPHDACPRPSSLHLVSPEVRFTQEMEASLARQAHAGRKDAADALVRAHLSSIRRLAMKLRWWGVPVDDLVQEGAIGLVQSMPKFRPELGVRLLSFSALGVRRRMLRAIAHHRGQGLASSGTVWGREFFRLRREIEASRRHGGDTVEWLADKMGLTRETARAAIAVQAPMLSLEAEGLVGMAPVSSQPNPEQLVLAFERNGLRVRAVQQSLSELPHRERAIVEQRLMAEPPMTYRGLGERLGISGERVKQLEVRALRRLKAKLAKRGVRSDV